MKILAIDTATELCGVAITAKHQFIAEYRLNRKNLHNEKLVIVINMVLQDAGLELDEIDCFALSSGPGSFTGLRIGFSVVKGMAFSLNKRFVTVNSLDALAYGIHYWQGNICSLVKARETECYTAFYRNKPDFKRTTDYRLVTTEQVSELIKQETLVVANPVALVEKITNNFIKPAALDMTLASPLKIAHLGYDLACAGKWAEPDSAEPFYLKDFKPI